MKLLTATKIVDRANLHPTSDGSRVPFMEDGVNYTLLTARNPMAITVSLRCQGMEETFDHQINPNDTPVEQAQRIAEWLVFTVEMTLSIRELTNA